MSESEASNWSRKADLVMQSLSDMRLSSDAALKGINELKIEFAKLAEQRRQDKEEIAEINARLDRVGNWVMGILATLIASGLIWAFNALTTIKR